MTELGSTGLSLVYIPSIEATGACCMAVRTIVPCAMLHKTGDSITCNDYHTLYPGVFRVGDCQNTFTVVTAISIKLQQNRCANTTGTQLCGGCNGCIMALCHNSIVLVSSLARFSLAASSLRRRRVRLVAVCEVYYRPTDVRPSALSLRDSYYDDEAGYLFVPS